jgi:hypothetical protein
LGSRDRHRRNRRRRIYRLIFTTNIPLHHAPLGTASPVKETNGTP